MRTETRATCGRLQPFNDSASSIKTPVCGVFLSGKERNRYKTKQKKTVKQALIFYDTGASQASRQANAHPQKSVSTARLDGCAFYKRDTQDEKKKKKDLMQQIPKCFSLGCFPVSPPVQDIKRHARHGTAGMVTSCWSSQSQQITRRYPHSDTPGSTGGKSTAGRGAKTTSIRGLFRYWSPRTGSEAVTH